MGKLWVAATVILVAASFVSRASAAPPVAVSIEITPTQFCCPEIGSWQASGAITDSGSFERTELHDNPSVPNLFDPQHTGAFGEVFLLSGAHGTLTVREESRLTTSGVIAVWQIESGTGDYDRVSGHGTGTFVFPTLLNTGVISKAD